MATQDATPVRGMRDFLPREAALRRSIEERIRKFYASCGYREIETPAVERKDLLIGSGGGENEKLIFKILKRGAKLSAAAASDDDLVDSGLRFDLTLPLSRYYALHAEELGAPFKSVQIGPVWRAERPQQGRFRQFTQCDIDILGEPSLLAELDLISTTAECLMILGFRGFEIRVNHRAILADLLSSWQVAPNVQERVLIALDKVDKIGADGVCSELEALGIQPETIQKATAWLTRASGDPIDMVSPSGKGDSHRVNDDLVMLIDKIRSISRGEYSVRYDPMMVRGMAYYTGTVFEVVYRDYPYSIAGGGRYDNMVGRLLGRPVPACGFSLGFDRIVGIIDRERLLPTTTDGGAVIFVDNSAEFEKAHELSIELRQRHGRSLIARKSKNLKRQLNLLSADGYTYAYFMRDGQVTTQQIEMVLPPSDGGPRPPRPG